MPSYDIATAAFAAGAPKKWLDNLASQHPVPGIERMRRGVTRDFSFEAVLAVWLVRSLCVELAIPVHTATRIAAEIQASLDGSITLPGGFTLSIDLEAAAREVRQRLLEAAESVPRVRRGRPPQAAANPPSF